MVKTSRENAKTNEKAVLKTKRQKCIEKKGKSIWKKCREWTRKKKRNKIENVQIKQKNFYLYHSNSAFGLKANDISIICNTNNNKEDNTYTYIFYHSVHAPSFTLFPLGLSNILFRVCAINLYSLSRLFTLYV